MSTPRDSLLSSDVHRAAGNLIAQQQDGNEGGGYCAGFSATILGMFGTMVNAMVFWMVPEDRDYLLWIPCSLPIAQIAIGGSFVLGALYCARSVDPLVFQRNVAADSLVAVLSPALAATCALFLLLISIIGKVAGRSSRAGIRDTGTELLASLLSTAALWASVAVWQFVIRRGLLRLGTADRSKSGYGTREGKRFGGASPPQVEGGIDPNDQRARWPVAMSMEPPEDPNDSDGSHFGKTAAQRQALVQSRHVSVDAGTDYPALWAFDVVFGPDAAVLCRVRSADSMEAGARNMMGLQRSSTAAAGSKRGSGARQSLLATPSGVGLHIPEATLVEVDSSDDEDEDDASIDNADEGQRLRRKQEDKSPGSSSGTLGSGKESDGFDAGGTATSTYYFAGGMRRTASRRAPSMRVGPGAAQLAQRRAPSLALRLLAHRSVDGNLLQALLRREGSLGDDVQVVGCGPRPSARVDGQPLGGPVPKHLERVLCITESDIDSVRRTTAEAVAGLGLPSQSEIDASLVGCSILVRADLCRGSEAPMGGTVADELELTHGRQGSFGRDAYGGASREVAKIGVRDVTKAICRVRGKHNRSKQNQGTSRGLASTRSSPVIGVDTASLIGHKTYGFEMVQVGSSDPPGNGSSMQTGEPGLAMEPDRLWVD